MNSIFVIRYYENYEVLLHGICFKTYKEAEKEIEKLNKLTAWISELYLAT